MARPPGWVGGGGGGGGDAAVIRRWSVLVREGAKPHAICHFHCRQLDVRCGHFGHKAVKLCGSFCWRLSDVSLHLSAVFARPGSLRARPALSIVASESGDNHFSVASSRPSPRPAPPSSSPPPSHFLFLTFSLPPRGFPNRTTTPLKDEPWQIYRHRLSIGRQRDSQDLKPPSHWPGADRLIYGCAVIWCLLPLKWVTALWLIGHRNGVGLRS